MGNVVRLPTGTNLSIRQLAEECGFDRDTIAKRIRNAGLIPAGKKGGHDVYRLREVLPVLFKMGEDGKQDPEKLDPFQRKAYYQAEREALELSVSRRDLIPRIECEEEDARVFKILAQACDTLPDILERDCGLSGEQLFVVEKVLDNAREQIYQELVESGDDQAPHGDTEDLELVDRSAR
jgi:hypothetical protein